MLSHMGDPVFATTHRREHDPAAAIAWIARDGTKPDGAAAHVARSKTLVETAMEMSCLCSPDLGIAGNGCLGGRVEQFILAGRPSPDGCWGGDGRVIY